MIRMRHISLDDFKNPVFLRNAVNKVNAMKMLVILLYIGISIC